jgi:hypothetical protein
MTIRAVLVMTASLLASCGTENNDVVIGSNDFAEQKILARYRPVTIAITCSPCSPGGSTCIRPMTATWRRSLVTR